MTMLRAGTEGSRAALDGDVDIDRDRGLVLLAQSGDRTAFDELYALYHRRLWRFCFKRLQDEHEAEDVTQEAFLRAWKALPGFAGDRRFYPWLSVIAAHLCTNVVRKRNRADPAGDLHDREALSWEYCGEDHVIAAHDSALASRALARLSPRHRLVLDLREGRGWSYRRIAEHEGIGIPAVESLLWRAREALKREFSAQAGEGRLAGFAGAALLTIRRWLRSPQVAFQQGAAFFPTASSVLVTSAATAMTAVAVGIGTLVPGFGSAAGSPALPTAQLMTKLPTASAPLWSLAIARSPETSSTPAAAWQEGNGFSASAVGPGRGKVSAGPNGSGPSSPLADAPTTSPSMNVETQLPPAPPAPTPSVIASTPSLPSSQPTLLPGTDPTPSAPTGDQIESTLGTATSGVTSSLPSTTTMPSTSTVPSTSTLPSPGSTIDPISTISSVG